MGIVACYYVTLKVSRMHHLICFRKHDGYDGYTIWQSWILISELDMAAIEIRLKRSWGQPILVIMKAVMSPLESCRRDWPSDQGWICFAHPVYNLPCTWNQFSLHLLFSRIFYHVQSNLIRDLKGYKSEGNLTKHLTLLPFSQIKYI